MANEYYRMPVAEWDRMQKVIMRLEADTNPEAKFVWHVAVQQRGAQLSRRRERLSRFGDLVRAENITIETSDQPCPCGKNHYAITVLNGQEYIFCPVVFWINMCQLMEEKGTQMMLKWAKDHPLKSRLVKIDPEKDATYED